MCQPLSGGSETPHRRSNFCAELGDLDVLEAGEPVGQRAHVAAALDVVLPAQRVEARAVSAHVAGQQRQVDQREDVIDRVVVLGDPEGPADHRPAGPGVGVRHLPDRAGGDARLPLGVGERVGLHGLAVRLEARRGVLDELPILEPGGDDLPGHGIGQRDVGTHVEAQPGVGPARGAGAPRVDRVEAGAVVDALEQVVEEDRVRLSRVRPPEQDDVRFLDLPVGVRPPTGPEHRRQTGDTRRVSRAVAAIDVVAAEHHARELLRDEVHLVRALGATEHPERVRAMPIDGLAQSPGGAIERLVPSRRRATGRRRGPAAPSA